MDSASTDPNKVTVKKIKKDKVKDRDGDKDKDEVKKKKKKVKVKDKDKEKQKEGGKRIKKDKLRERERSLSRDGDRREVEGEGESAQSVPPRPQQSIYIAVQQVHPIFNYSSTVFQLFLSVDRQHFHRLCSVSNFPCGDCNLFISH